MTKHKTVGDFMTANLISISETASLAEAAGILDSNKITGLPVVDDTGLLIGVLSQTDLSAPERTSTSFPTGPAWRSGRS